MEVVIKSVYGPYRLAASLVAGLKSSPLELLNKEELRGVQFVRPESVASARHIVAAFAAAATTWLSSTARTRRIEVEFLVRLSGRRQIQEALERVGLRGDESSVVVVVITPAPEDPEPILMRVAERLGGVAEPFNPIAKPEELMEAYRIGVEQLRVVPRCPGADPLELLILERVVASYLE